MVGSRYNGDEKLPTGVRLVKEFLHKPPINQLGASLELHLWIAAKAADRIGKLHRFFKQCICHDKSIFAFSCALGKLKLPVENN